MERRRSVNRPRLQVLLALLGLAALTALTIHAQPPLRPQAARRPLPPHPGIVKPRALPPCAQVGQTVTLSLNTGTAGTVPPGAADPIWKIVSPAITPFSTTPHPLWVPNSTASRWIQPSTSGNLGSFPVATYVYTTQFTTPVDPYLYSSITITGNFAADDVAKVELNGWPIANCAGGTNSSSWCFNTWKAIPPGTDWQKFKRPAPFLNTLTVEVKNTLATSTSGLNIQAKVVAVCSKCTSPLPPIGPPCGGNPSNCRPATDNPDNIDHAGPDGEVHKPVGRATSSLGPALPIRLAALAARHG